MLQLWRSGVLHVSDGGKKAATTHETLSQDIGDNMISMSMDFSSNCNQDKNKVGFKAGIEC